MCGRNPWHASGLWRTSYCTIIPADWDQFTIEKDFRGKHLHIVVENPEHVQSGCKALYVNEEKMEDNYIPVEKMTDQTKVRLVMA